MTVSLCPTAGAFFQGFTAGGLPLNGGLIYSFISGGTTPQATYTDSGGGTPNANPIVLDAAGRPPSEIWLTNGSAYRFDLYDSASNLIKTYDNVSGIQPSSAGLFLLLAGGTMSGNIAMGGTNKITGSAAATANGDLVRYEQSPPGLLTAKGGLISASAANVPAVVTVGANGLALVANSNAATGMNWASPALRAFLGGCAMSTAGGSATMSIAAGTAVDSTNVSAMALAAIAKTTSAWAVGTGNGGLDTGAIAATSWYHFYVIQRVDTGVVDVTFSLNPTTPTLPTNYTLFRRIGSGLTNGASNWILFKQFGNLFTWDLPVADINVTNPGTAAVTRTMASIPTGVVVEAWFSAIEWDVGLSYYAIYTALDQTDTAASATIFSVAVQCVGAISVSRGGDFYIKTNTSAQFRTRCSASAAGNVSTYTTKGWIDRRGQDS